MPSLAKHINYGAAHPPISRRDVPTMGEWLGRHPKDGRPLRAGLLGFALSPLRGLRRVASLSREAL